MKGLRLEKMDDILHDFKNPAIAVAGFAKRVQKMLKEGTTFRRKKGSIRLWRLSSKKLLASRNWLSPSTGREERRRST